MATAYSIDKYRDPEKIDLSSTFQAQAYKQQNYDINTTQTQQLINQYASTDLLRDVDKQYFGERLNTLVGFINQSGTRDWSRKSIASELQNYVSTALDKNVMSAIASTQSFRKQQAEIDDIKKNKPDQYSMQNEWFATQDLQRYLGSQELGDSYRAQSYTPYTDVKKAILDNADKLKDFGVEYYTDTIGGNSYFRQIGTFEKIDPEKAKQFLSTVMDAKTMNQLYIDGQYSYKDTDATSVKDKYMGKLESYNKVYDERLTELRTLMAGAPKAKKAEYQAAITTLESNKNEVNKSKSLNLSKQAMVDYLYRSDFENKWTGFLSYNRLKDWKIDDSGFKIWKGQTDLQMANRNYNLQVDKFKHDAQMDVAKMNQADAHFNAKMTADGFKKNADGTYAKDPASSIIATDVPKELGDEKVPTPYKNVKDEFMTNYGLLINNVGNELLTELQRPENASVLKQLQAKGLGKNNAQQMASMLINSPEGTRYLYKLLSPNSRTLVDSTLSSKQRMIDLDTPLNAVSKDLTEYANALTSSNTKPTTKQHVRSAIGGMTLDSNGNVVQGDVLQGSHKYAQIARKAAVINQQLMSGDLSQDDAEKYKRILENDLIGSGMSSKKVQNALDKLVFKKTYNGFWEGAAQGAARLLLGSNDPKNPKDFGAWLLKEAQETANYFNDSKVKLTFADDAMAYANSADTQGNKKGVFAMGDHHVANAFGRVNEDLGSIGLSDVDSSKLSYDPSTMTTRFANQMRAIDEKILQDKTTTFNKALNIDMSSDYGKSIQGNIKALLPVGTEIQKDSNLQITIDKSTGMANITTSIKKGKEFVTETLPVKLTDLPTSLLQQVDLSEKNRVYSAANPYAVKYTSEVEVPADMTDWSRKVNLMPYEERTEAFNNPPTTQQEILGRLDAAYGKELVEKNMTSIKQILDSPVQIKMIPDRGQWTVVASQNGDDILRQPTTFETYDPNLIEKVTNTISTQAIETRLNQMLNPRNARK